MTLKINQEKPLYIISVAAQMVGVHPQTLRLYERLGLIKPSRSRGKTRLYSQEDIERIKEIQHLTKVLGVNLKGAEIILNMQEVMKQMRQEMEEERERLRLEILR